MAVTRSHSNSTRRRTPSPKAKVTKETAAKKKSKSSGKGLTKDAICSKLLPELKGLCDSYSVSSHGTRPEIVRRLLKHTNNSNLGDAIVVAEVNIPGDACSVSRVKQALIEATNNAAFFVQEIHGRKFIVDEESLSYATAKMDVPDDKNKLQEAEETITQLEKQPMQISSEKEAKWNDVRHRVISTFKRHRNVATDNDMSLIERVSGLIHDGDAVTDAGLFQPYGPRTDVDAYQRIYGLRPEEVCKIESNPAIIKLLNVYGSNMLYKPNITEHVQRAEEKMFDFVKRFREVNHDTSFLRSRHKNNKLYHAYDDCLDYTKNLCIKP